MNRKTPLYEWHQSHRAKMAPFAGWDMPIQYGQGILKEHLGTRKFGGLFDISHMARFSVSGKDALRFLQHVLSNNAAALEPGQAQYTILPSPTGGAIDDAYLYRPDADEYLLVVNASNAQKDWEWLKSHNGFEIKLTDKTDELSMIAIQGPNSKKLLQGTAKGTLPQPGRNNLCEMDIAGCETVVSRTGYTGEPVGFEVFVPSKSVEAFWGALAGKGEGSGIGPVGLGARDTLRLEAGLPLYGHEFGMDKDANEIPIFAVPLASFAVSFSSLKGDFIGRDSLLAQNQELKQRLRGTWNEAPENSRLPGRILPFCLEERGVVREGSEIVSGGESLGYVTSATTAPYWEFEGEGLGSEISDRSATRCLGLAYVDSWVEDERPVSILYRQKEVRARLVRRHLAGEAPPYARPLPAGGAGSAGQEKKTEAFGKKVDRLLELTMENTKWRRQECINLIPSEQTPSPLVRMLTIADPMGRYAEHKVFEAFNEHDVFYYQGTRFIGDVEQHLCRELIDYLGCDRVEPRLVSGQMANAAVFSAMVAHRNRLVRKQERKRMACVMNHHLGKGGHLSSQPMGALRDYVAVDPQSERFGVVNFPVLEENPYEVDVDKTIALIEEKSPELIILGKSMILQKEPVREIAQKLEGMPNRPFLMYDMAHVLGLLGPSFQEPFAEGADLVTGSTHKTFFGTQRGIVSMKLQHPESETLWEQVERRAFPGSVSNHHLGTLLGLLLASYEMNAFGRQYQEAVIGNAKSFARSLRNYGLHVEGSEEIGFTQTHQVILRAGYAVGPEAAGRLERNNIIVNYQALPDDEGFSCSSGLRLGVQEMTRFGMGPDSFDHLAKLIARCVLKAEDVRTEATKLRQAHLKMGYCMAEDEAAGRMDHMLKALR